MRIKKKDLIPPIYYKIIARFKKNNKSSKNYPYSGRVIRAFSQYGEDLIIDAIFENKKSGFYIDIGAHDPVKLSNTKRFYDKGWHGINIEPNPVLFKQFVDDRKNDINLNIGIGSKVEELEFYELSMPEHSTFNKSIADKITKTSKLKIVNKYKVPVWPLYKIYSEVVRSNKVDFLSIDTEGFEIEVLSGNDWDINRPKLIIIEMGDNHNQIYEYLISKQYVPLSFNHVNAFFIDKLLPLKE